MDRDETDWLLQALFPGAKRDGRKWWLQPQVAVARALNLANQRGFTLFDRESDGTVNLTMWNIQSITLNACISFTAALMQDGVLPDVIVLVEVHCRTVAELRTKIASAFPGWFLVSARLRGSATNASGGAAVIAKRTIAVRPNTPPQRKVAAPQLKVGEVIDVPTKEDGDESVVPYKVQSASAHAMACTPLLQEDGNVPLNFEWGESASGQKTPSFSRTCGADLVSCTVSPSGCASLELRGGYIGPTGGKYVREALLPLQEVMAPRATAADRTVLVAMDCNGCDEIWGKRGQRPDERGKEVMKSATEGGLVPVPDRDGKFAASTVHGTCVDLFFAPPDVLAHDDDRGVTTGDITTTAASSGGTPHHAVTYPLSATATKGGPAGVTTEHVSGWDPEKVAAMAEAVFCNQLPLILDPKRDPLPTFEAMWIRVTQYAGGARTEKKNDGKRTVMQTLTSMRENGGLNIAKMFAVMKAGDGLEPLSAAQHLSDGEAQKLANLASIASKNDFDDTPKIDRPRLQRRLTKKMKKLKKWEVRKAAAAGREPPKPDIVIARIQAAPAGVKPTASAARNPWHHPRALRLARQSKSFLECLHALYLRVLGSTPSAWKSAWTVLLPKKGIPRSVPATCAQLRSETRGIALLDPLSKPFEMILRDELLRVVGDMIPSSQCAFLWLRCIDDIHIALSGSIHVDRLNALICFLLLFDQSSAFDRILPELLCLWLMDNVKQCPYWLIEALMAWFRERRSQARVRTASGKVVTGTTEDVGAGAPQGTVLGPIVFLLYVIVLSAPLSPESLRKLRFEFADDLTVKIAAAVRAHALTAVNEVIRIVTWWAGRTNMKVRETKCKIMESTKDAPAQKERIMIGEGEAAVELEWIDVCKIPGLWYDTDMRFARHVRFVLEKLTAVAHGLRILRESHAGTVAQLRGIAASLAQECVTRSTLAWYPYITAESRRRIGVGLGKCFAAVAGCVYAPSAALLRFDLNVFSVEELHRIYGASSLTRVMTAPTGRAAELLRLIREHGDVPGIQDALEEIRKALPVPVFVQSTSPVKFWDKHPNWANVEVIPELTVQSQELLDQILLVRPDVGLVVHSDGSGPSGKKDANSSASGHGFTIEQRLARADIGTFYWNFLKVGFQCGRVLPDLQRAHGALRGRKHERLRGLRETRRLRDRLALARTQRVPQPQRQGRAVP